MTLSIVILNRYFLFGKDSKDVKEIVHLNSSVKVGLRNGCGYPDIAKKVKDYILENYENIDVLSCKNVPENKFIYNKTIIVVKNYNEEKLRYLQKLTEIERRIYAFNDNHIENFYIILGKDYKNYFK